MKLSVRAAAAEEPRRIALVAEGREIDYAALARRVEHAAAWACARGAAEAPVGLVAEPALDAVVLLLALVELGTPAVLLHPRLTPAERSTHLAAAGASMLLAPEPVLMGTGTRATHDRQDDTRPLAILFTSGSTGTPKAVELSRAAFLAAAAASAAHLGLRDDDRWLLSLSPAHVGGLSILVRALWARRAVVLAPRPRFDPADVAATIERERVTLLSLVPTQLRRLLALEPTWTPPPRLRAILLGGAAVPAPLLAEAARRGWPVLPTYGMTETCAQAATVPPGTPPAAAQGCGPPLPGVEVRIEDDGVIAARGPTLFTRYLPAGAHVGGKGADGWFRTGDLGRLDAGGRLHVLGRADDIIVTGGEKVAPAEVEAALCEHRAVGAACVFGIADPEWGQAVAVALEAAAGQAQPTMTELAGHLSARLAPFKRPKWIAWLPALPLTPGGKIDRRATAAACAGRLARPSPPAARSSSPADRGSSTRSP